MVALWLGVVLKANLCGRKDAFTIHEGALGYMWSVGFVIIYNIVKSGSLSYVSC